MRGRLAAAGLLLVLALSGALYWRVTRYPFLQWDDPHYVSYRLPLQRIAAGDLGALADLLAPWRSAEGVFWEYFPVRDLSLAIDAYRGGLAPRPFHQTNLILHLLATLLVFWIARRFVHGPGALLAAALFAFHPLAVEPTAWVSGRKDLLYVCCTLGALLCYLRALDGSWRCGILFCGLTLLAFGSKGPGVVVVPLAAWLVLLRPRVEWRRRWLQLLPLAAAAVAWGAVALRIGWRERIIVAPPDGPVGAVWRALGAPVRALTTYLVPVDLAPRCDAWPTPWWQDPHSWTAVALLLGAVLAMRRGLLRRAPPWLLCGCFLIAVAPTAGLVSVNQVRADRFLYLPLGFLAILTAWAVAALAGRRRWWALLCVALLPLGAQTHRYLDAWRGDLEFWRYQHRQDPQNPIANGALAALALERGQLDVAKPLLDRALAGAPRVAVTWVNVGLWWTATAGPGPLRPADRLRAARLAEAERAFARSLALDPTRSLAHESLGRIAAWRGDARTAEHHLRVASRYPQTCVSATLLLGDLLWGQGRRDEARAVVSEMAARVPGSELRRWLGRHELAGGQ
jgi:hypothetical protein